jgi:hypothetical protein
LATDDHADGWYVDHQRSTTPRTTPVTTAAASTTGVAGPAYVDGGAVVDAGGTAWAVLMPSSLARREPADLGPRYRTADRRYRRRTTCRNLQRLISSRLPTSRLGGAYSEAMATSSGRRHLASSPFKPKVELPIENFESDDLVSHDSYGVGRVVSVEADAVTVNFRDQTVRVSSPYRKMTKL